MTPEETEATSEGFVVVNAFQRGEWNNSHRPIEWVVYVRRPGARETGKGYGGSFAEALRAAMANARSAVGGKLEPIKPLIQVNLPRASLPPRRIYQEAPAGVELSMEEGEAEAELF